MIFEWLFNFEKPFLYFYDEKYLISKIQNLF